MSPFSRRRVLGALGSAFGLAGCSAFDETGTATLTPMPAPAVTETPNTIPQPGEPVTRGGDLGNVRSVSGGRVVVDGVTLRHDDVTQLVYGPKTETREVLASGTGAIGLTVDRTGSPGTEGGVFGMLVDGQQYQTVDRSREYRTSAPSDITVPGGRIGGFRSLDEPVVLVPHGDSDSMTVTWRPTRESEVATVWELPASVPAFFADRPDFVVSSFGITDVVRTDGGISATVETRVENTGTVDGTFYGVVVFEIEQGVYRHIPFAVIEETIPAGERRDLDRTVNVKAVATDRPGTVRLEWSDGTEQTQLYYPPRER